MARLARCLTFLLVALLGAAPALGGGEGEGDPFDCRARALVVDPDAGFLRVYDGIRKGLELAHLPRVCREDLVAGPRKEGAPDPNEAVLQRLEKEPPELLFVIGRVAAGLLGTRLAAVPRVYVDTAWSVNDVEYPPAPEPPPPAAVVRSVVKPVHVAEILRDVLGTRPVGQLSWQATTPELEQLAEDVAVAAGFRLPKDDGEGESGPPAALLHLRFGMGEQPASLEELLERAKATHALLVSDDLEHWRHGVPVLVLPDFDLLGRVAADAGRELLETPEPPRVLRRRVAVPEVRVDLRAAQALGLELPVPFLAGVDVLRGPRRAGGR